MTEYFGIPLERLRIEEILKVWLYPEALEERISIGASACKANSTDRRNYKEVNKDG